MLLAGILLALHPGADAQKQKQASKEDKQGAQREERLDRIRRELQDATDRAGLRMREGLNSEPLINGYISALGQELVPSDVPASQKFSFRVINAPEPNAFALADGRIYVTTGIIAMVENEAQLASVLGHEIGHVINNHHINSIYRQRYGKVATTTRIAGSAMRILGGGGSRAAGEVAKVGLGIFGALTGARYQRSQEIEADLVGLRQTLALNLDPSEAAGFWEKMHRRFGEPSPLMALFSGHPTHSRRSELAREVVATELAQEIGRKSGSLQTGGADFSRLTSVVRRDSSIQLSEVLDRHDLALEGLEAVLPVRSDDPKLLWAIGRIHRLTERSGQENSLALRFLQRAAESDKRGLFPAIHRDLGYAYATSAGDFPSAVQSLQTYVDRHVRKHGTYPPDLETVYDYMGLFGDTGWNAPSLPTENTVSVLQQSYAAPVWQTPGGASVEGSTAFLREAYQAAQEPLMQGPSDSN